MLAQLGSIAQLLDSNGVDDADRVACQVPGVSQLTPDSQVSQEGVDGGLVVCGNRGGLEVLDELADTHHLTRRAELLLDGVEGGDGRLRPVRAQQVPGVEAREVLQRTQKLVPTNCYSISIPVYPVLTIQHEITGIAGWGGKSPL